MVIGRNEEIESETWSDLLKVTQLIQQVQEIIPGLPNTRVHRAQYPPHWAASGS